MANPTLISDWSLILNEGAISATASMPSIGAGTNRTVLVLMVNYNGAGTASVPATINSNGRTAQLIAGHTTAQTRLALGVYCFFEDDVSSISGQTLNSTGGSGSQKSIFVKVLGDTKQSLTTYANTGYATTSQTINVSLARQSESVTEAIAFTSTSATSLTMSNPTRVSTASLTSTRRVSWGYQNDTTGTSDTVVTGNAYTGVIAFNITVPPVQSIDTVNSGNPVKLGQSVNWTTTGFSPDINSATLDGIACTAASASGFTPNILIDEQTTARPGTRALIGTNGTQSDDINIIVEAPLNNSYQTLADPLDTGNYSCIQNFSPAAVQGDFVVFPTVINGQNTGTAVDPSGLFSTNNDGQQICWHIQNSTKIARSYIVTTGASGVTVKRALAAVGLSAVGISASGLAVVGL